MSLCRKRSTAHVLPCATARVRSQHLTAFRAMSVCAQRSHGLALRSRRATSDRVASRSRRVGCPVRVRRTDSAAFGDPRARDPGTIAGGTMCYLPKQRRAIRAAVDGIEPLGGRLGRSGARLPTGISQMWAPLPGASCGSAQPPAERTRRAVSPQTDEGLQRASNVGRRSRIAIDSATSAWAAAAGRAQGKRVTVDAARSCGLALPCI